jgi:hypothetical protein
LKLQNAPGYRCSGDFLWAAYAAFFTGLTPSTDYFATFKYTVGVSDATCGGSKWGWTDHGERTITERFSTTARETTHTEARVTPINQGMSVPGSAGWATPSIPIDNGMVVVYLKFTAKLYKSNKDIAGLNLTQPQPRGGPYSPDQFNGKDPSKSMAWFDDAFQYGANHSSGFLGDPMPSSAVELASVTHKLEMHICCCDTDNDYGNYKSIPPLDLHDTISQAFEVPDGLRMMPRN